MPKVSKADAWLLADALIEGGDPDCVAKCSNWFVRSPGLVSPLLRAAWVGDDNACRMLLEANADVDTRLPRHGATALHLAVGDHPFEWSSPWMARIEVGRQLMEAKADPTIQDKYGRTALDAARDHRNQPMIEALEAYLQEWAGKSQKTRFAERARAVARERMRKRVHVGVDSVAESNHPPSRVLTSRVLTSEGVDALKVYLPSRHQTNLTRVARCYRKRSNLLCHSLSLPPSLPLSVYRYRYLTLTLTFYRSIDIDI